MRLNIFKETQARLPLKKLKRMFHKLSEEEKKPGWEGLVNLIFAGDEELLRLNRKYRKVGRPTDVLAFTIDHPASRESILGEVYVSVPMAKLQAAEAGTDLADELVRLSCHGFLHLFGYDHVRKRDLEQMRALEDYYVSYSKRADDG